MHFLLFPQSSMLEIFVHSPHADLRYSFQRCSLLFDSALKSRTVKRSWSSPNPLFFCWKRNIAATILWMQVIRDHSSYLSKRDCIRSCRTHTDSVLSGVGHLGEDFATAEEVLKDQEAEPAVMTPVEGTIWSGAAEEMNEFRSALFNTTGLPHTVTAHWNEACLKRAVLSLCQEPPRWPQCKESTCQCRRPRHRLNSWVRKIPWSRKWQPAPVFLPEKCHGQRSLVGYSPGGHKESVISEGMSTQAL